ncbi:MAG: ATP-binding protein [Candidatus Aminicenantes bacterium]|jgi:predicted AAA+ superfamily ATPase
MIEREISRYLKNLSEKYPVVTVTGPRQSGKTTLVKHLFKNMNYVNLEDPEEREFAKDDPKGFLSRIPDGAILDEIQRVPELLSYIQVITDDTKWDGTFILTGSRQFELMDSIDQSLAGRTALLKLLPLSLSELENHHTHSSINELIHKGFYPRIFDRQLDPYQAYGDYYETYVERDIRQLINIKNLSQFQKFVKLCAGRIGQLLNLTSIGNDIGISHTTAREWMSILEASYVIFLLEPFYKNIRKRLVKSPKIYFYDVGLAAYLLGIENESYLENHPLKGNLFENLVLMEILKYRYNCGKKNNLNFYRDSTGNEVDVIYNIAQKVVAVEIKSAKTIHTDFFKGLQAFESTLPETILAKALIYGGDRSETRKGIHIFDVYGIKKFLNSLSLR